MTTIVQGIESIWRDGPPLIGMIHLLPLPGAPAWGGSMDAVIDRATADADMLTEAGFNAVMVENYSDVPFLRGSVPAETVAAMTAAVVAVRGTTSLPVGVNVLRNDPLAAVGIAAASGALFVRVNVHTGSMWTDQGLVEGDASLTLRLRARLGARVAILADVHVKHATPPSGAEIGATAADTWYRGLADALIVSGVGTGAPTRSGDLEAVRAAVPEAPVLVGSGVTPQNASRVLGGASGAIVGSAVMAGGVAGSGVELSRARALVEAVGSSWKSGATR